MRHDVDHIYSSSVAGNPILFGMSKIIVNLIIQTTQKQIA